MSSDSSGPSDSIRALLNALPTPEEALLSTAPAVYTHELDEWLLEVSLDGEVTYEWSLVSRIVAMKINSILQGFFEREGFLGPITQTFEKRRVEVLNLVINRDEPPFTVQRLIELIVHPYVYKKTHKLINAMEKLLLITSPPETKMNIVKRPRKS